MAAALRRRWRLLAIVAALTFVLLVAAGVAVISWMFSLEAARPGPRPRALQRRGGEGRPRRAGRPR